MDVQPSESEIYCDKLLNIEYIFCSTFLRQCCKLFIKVLI